MPRADTFTVPDAVRDHTLQTCYDPTTNDPLPNFAGLCLFTGSPSPMVMNTWLEGGVRQWQLVCMGWNVPNRVLDEVLKKAS